MMAWFAVLAGGVLALSQVFTLYPVPALFVLGIVIAFMAGLVICDRGGRDGARDD